MLKVLLQKFALVFFFHQSVIEGKDLLGLFKPKSDLPQELNEFLTDVQRHKEDFAFIRNVAKNRRKYEKSYREHHQLLADDIDAQMTVNPEYNKKEISFENAFENPLPPIKDSARGSSYSHNGNSLFSGYPGRSNDVKSYPKERYSKFIHSPVRLRRELEENYLNKHVEINPNGAYGSIGRPEPRFPVNKFVDDDNRYHTGYVVGEADDVDDSDGDDDDYYQALKPPEKQKREVEISIKSDGKLVKHIEEDENGPKSIVLNIKSNNPNAKLIDGSGSNNAITAASIGTVAASSEALAPVNNYLSNEPSNSKTIPSLTNSNSNQNNIQSKNIGVPINAVVAGNNIYSGNKNAVTSSTLVSRENPFKTYNDRNSNNVKNYNIPEISRVSETGDDRLKYEQDNMKHFNNYYKPESSYGDFKLSGENSHMAKSIDMAQNNINSFENMRESQPGLNLDFNENKPDEFEKVQGLVMDNTNLGDNNKMKDKYKKRESIKGKRWNELEKRQEFDENQLTGVNKVMDGFDYAEPLELEANDANMPQLEQEHQEDSHPESSLESGDEKIHLDPNKTFEVIEKQTKDIMVIPEVSTTPCSFDIHVPQPSSREEEERKEHQQEVAEEIGEAIAEEIRKEEEATDTAECLDKEKEEQREEQAEQIGELIAEEIEKAEGVAETTNECEITTAEKVIEIIQHDNSAEVITEQGEEQCTEEHTENENVEQIEIIKENPEGHHHHHHHHHHHRHHHHHHGHLSDFEDEEKHIHKRESAKRSNKEKSKKTIIVKQEKHKGKKKHKHKDKHHPKRKQKKRGNSEDKEALRNRKHLPAVPKYKRKRIRQHPKKRIERDIEDPSFSDFYDLNEYYEEPNDALDLVPSYRRRQLKAANYEFDPGLMQDVDNHEKEDIEKFEKTMKNKKKFNENEKDNKQEENIKGSRKKFRSEEDYSDEEDSITAKPAKKMPIKKTQNQFAIGRAATTEDNDDDYNYSDLTDMDDEDEDIAYEEEETQGDNLDVEEAIGNNNGNEHENDRLNLNKPVTIMSLKQMEQITEKAKDVSASIASDLSYPLYNIDNVMSEANKLIDSPGAHAHGQQMFKKKKQKKKNPKQEVKTKDTKEDLRTKKEATVNRPRIKRRKKRLKSRRLNKNSGVKKPGTESEMVSNFRGRGPHAVKNIKDIKKKPKRQSENNGLSNGNAEDHMNYQMSGNEKLTEPFQQKPMSNEEKQDIFLRYNPEFQRWPRFVQRDNQYHELMRRRAMENKRRYLRNSLNQNRFPISNEYFLVPRQEFVKRQEPSTAPPEPGASEAAAAPATDAAAAPGETSAAAAAPAETPAAAPPGETPAADASGETPAAAAPGETPAGAVSGETPVPGEAPASGVSGEPPSGAAPNNPPEGEAGMSSPASEGAAPPSANGGPAAEPSLDEATLPQAAQNILQTANSDIFDNTTVPALGGVGEGGNGAGVGGNNAAAGGTRGSTLFEFTTNADDLTSGGPCATTQKEQTPCPEEGRTHSPVIITSVLPLLPETATQVKLNMTKDQFMDLNEIVGGILPRQVVSESLSNAKGRVRPGLNKRRYNMNVMLSGYNSTAETNLILREMTNLMQKLKYHTTCQILQPNLLSYVKIITKNEVDDPMGKLKEMNDIDFDEHQSNYVFHTLQSDSIKDKAEVLKELLNKYNNMPQNCKERAEPVKEYIESHLAMIDRVAGKGVSAKVSSETVMTETVAPASESPSVKPKAKKEISISNSEDQNEETLNSQMMEEGLKNQNADANGVIEDHEKKNKREAVDPRLRFRDINTSTSPQYGKLADAVRNLKNKREVIERISEIFGRVKRDDDGKFAQADLGRNEEKGFESPQVINF